MAPSNSSRSDAVAWSDEPGNQEGRCGDEHDRASDGQIMAPGEVHADERGHRSDEWCEHHHHAEAVGQQTCRRGGGDQQREHQDVADGLQRDHHGEGHADVQHQVESEDAESHRSCHFAIECDGDEVSVEERDRREYRESGRGDDDHVGIGDAGDRAEQELLQRPRVAGSSRDDHDAESERCDEEHADDRVLLDPAVLGEHGDEHCGDHPGDRAADDEAALDDERDGDPGEHGVGDRITDEGHAAQHDVTADDAADDRGHDGDRECLGEERQVGVEQVGQELGERHGQFVSMSRSSGLSSLMPNVSIHDER